MAIGDTRGKDPCPHCNGPYGECTELRGGFALQSTCKHLPTYTDLLKQYNELKVKYDDLEEYMKDFMERI